MSALAAVASGVLVYLAVAAATDRLPRLRLPRRRRPQVGAAQTWLLQAGVDLTPGQFWAGSAGLAAGAFVLVVAVTGTPAVAVVPAVGVGALPRLYFARQRTRRLREIQRAWPDGLRDLLASISAGLSLNQAVESLARSGPAPLRAAFARYPTLARLTGVVGALETVKEELADPTSDRVIEVLILAHERGGHILADILDDLARATTRDLRAREETATAQLEQTLNARAVFVLPWLVLLVLTAADGPYRDFYRSAAGLAVVGVGGLLSVLGLWIVARLGRRPVEERVLGSAAPAPTGDGWRP